MQAFILGIAPCPANPEKSDAPRVALRVRRPSRVAKGGYPPKSAPNLPSLPRIP